MALLVLREVFRFLSERKPKAENGGAGSKSVEFWQQQQRMAVREVLNDLIAPFLAAQTDILRAIRESSEKTRDGIQTLVNHAENQRDRDRDRDWKHQQ